MMEAGLFFNSTSGIHPEKPLLNIVWQNNEKVHAAIASIEDILDPIEGVPQIVPEIIRRQVVESYGDVLKPYLVKT